MPIRIYALARKLKVESKVIVELCSKLGIAGKESVHAGLNEEEEAKIRDYCEKNQLVENAGKTEEKDVAKSAENVENRTEAAPPKEDVTKEVPAPPQPEPPTAPQAEAKPATPAVSPTRKKRRVTAPGKSRPLSSALARAGRAAAPSADKAETKPTQEEAAEDTFYPSSPETKLPAFRKPPPEEKKPVEKVDEEPLEEVGVDEVVEQAVAEEVTSEQTAEVAPEEASEETTPQKPEPALDASGLPQFRPQAQGESLPAFAPSTDANAEEEANKRRPKPKPGSKIHLAALPQAQLPKAQKPKKEAAPQKPDIRLSVDAISAVRKSGTTAPLAEQLRKHDEQSKDPKEKSSRPRRGQKSAEKIATLSLEELEAAGKEAKSKPKDLVMLGGREQRQQQRQKSKRRRRNRQEEEDGTSRSRRANRIYRTGANTAAPRKAKVQLELPCTVRSFSQAIGISVSQVLQKMLTLSEGVMPSINSTLEHEMAELLAMELGAEVEFKEEASLEEQLAVSLESDDAPEDLTPRPPVITFLGHVDHGKTSLLDRIIGIDVVSGESGGITQHIRAYKIEKEGREIAFVDTPGHEAFTEMRARGANVTDIAVLVIAADDGVMPQTEEAISHIKAAGVPIIVALNKIDLPGVDENKAYQGLAANELLPTEWGGDIEVVKTSAITGKGLDDLLETILTVAELHELKANPNREATGTCLEAELHEGRGVIAKMLVRNGTLKVGNVVLCGQAYGRVKAMYDTLHPRLRHEMVGPATPVNVTGLNAAPGAGDAFYVLDDIGKAREMAEQRAKQERERELLGAGFQPHRTLEEFYLRIQESEIKTLNVILRADVRGSIEAIKKEFGKLAHNEVQVRILQASVGGVSEADVHLADASDAVIIAFNVVADEGARLLAEQKSVQIRRYDIIYQVTDDLKKALEGMLTPEVRDKELGRVLVKRTFSITRLGTIAGCLVLSGSAQRDSRVRIIRDNRIIGDYPMESLRREKDDAKEVKAGLECGIRVKGFNDMKDGDILEIYRVEKVARTFDGGK